MQFLYSTAFLFLTLLGFSQETFSVYFDSAKHDLTAQESKRLLDWINQNSKSKILSMEGFTDEVGSANYNDTLSLKRVASIYNQIQNKVAIRDDFRTNGFGESQQISDNKAENRRVTVYYIEAKDLAREDEILGIKKEEIAPKSKPKKQFPEAIVIQNPNGTESTFELNVEFMQQVDAAKPGEKLKLENLNFQLNTFAIVNESRGKLYELLIVMQQNPELSIDIQGHLCCMPTDRTNLSTQRAKAISQFLRMNGIENSRVTYQGFGSSKPIYPLPEKNEEERAANRRVEIEIVKN